jgi:hypothetical protein
MTKAKLKGLKITIDEYRSVGVCKCSDNGLQIHFTNKKDESRYWRPVRIRVKGDIVTTVIKLSPEAVVALHKLIHDIYNPTLK